MFFRRPRALLLFLMKEFVNGGSSEFSLTGSNFHLRFEDLSYVTQPCFWLHNFCELHKELVHQNLVENAKKYYSKFQPTNKTSGYQTNNNESTGKKFSRIFVKYFEWLFYLFANKKVY